MKFNNKNLNYKKESEMSGITNRTINDPTEFERKQMDLFGRKDIQELKEKVKEIEGRKPVVAPVIAVEEHLTFWNHLNDIQYVSFDSKLVTKANTWLVTKDGSWLVQKNNSGYYAVKKTDEGIPTLPKGKEYPVAFFNLTYGKIPNSLIETVVAFFRDIMKRYNDAEAFVQIYWDKVENKYIINVPKQRVSKGSVRYDATENLNAKEPSRYVFAYECHSHNSMGAFWSGTDNADEKELRLYGVFGNLDQDKYTQKHRFFVGEEMIDVSLDLIFDLPKEEEKMYLVTHNNKQYIVNGNKVTLDDKPKYLYENDKGEKFLVPLDSVTLYKTNAPVPEDWFGSINVAFETEKTESTPTYRHKFPEYSKKEKSKPKTFWKDDFWDANDPFFYSDRVKDGWSPNADVWDAQYEELTYEMSQAVAEISMLTNQMSDHESIGVLLECLEAEHMLKDLEDAIKNYYSKSWNLDEGPTDGKYSNK